ncbi:TPM domain-containing protein [Blastococcus brunescens]|uniref:TPM domain-containing protein n=1 Tax=Blastococcus brunescens TaxID=1564165 RepID=A0ABZ1B8K1_9ACTN|nr:TPM domain-containing protein [Blastococcus sp. BMG 8361]WRL65704.1 TPM domain-containing protein [Blastococcus sp. BMG 8361]
MHRVLAVLAGFVVLLLTGTGPAVAEPPFAVDALLTDPNGALGAQAAEVESALEAVRDETGGSLHVVLVSTFEEAGTDWAEQVATQSDLGSSYLLFAMAVDDNGYQWWLGDTFPYDVTEVDQLITAAAQPQVLNGHWSGAVTALADGLRTGDIPEASDGAGSTSWSGATTSAIVGGALLVLLAAHQLSRRSQSRQAQASSDAAEVQDPTG